jgi:hypothetical protein
MKVVTPAMKLNVRIDGGTVREGQLVLEGVAGVLPCQTTLSPPELRRLIAIALQPRVLALLLRRG